MRKKYNRVLGPRFFFSDKCIVLHMLVSVLKDFRYKKYGSEINIEFSIKLADAVKHKY